MNAFEHLLHTINLPRSFDVEFWLKRGIPRLSGRCPVASMADLGISGASEGELIKHLVAYGVQGEDAKAALAADASAFQAVMETLLANVFRVPGCCLKSVLRSFMIDLMR